MEKKAKVNRENIVNHLKKTGRDCVKLSDETKIEFSMYASSYAEVIADIVELLRDAEMSYAEAKEILRDTEKIIYLGAKV